MSRENKEKVCDLCTAEKSNSVLIYFKFMANFKCLCQIQAAVQDRWKIIQFMET